MTMKLLACAALLLVSTVSANAQFYPDRYGYAWYPRQYSGGYYRAPYYGGWSGPSCGYYGCYARSPYGYSPSPYMRSGFGDYRQYRYVAPHRYYRTVHPRDAGGEFGFGW
jgi:hypothetical protein